MHVLVEAMPRVLRSYPNASCVVVGGEHAMEPDYPRFLGRRIAELGLGDRVLLAGLQPNVPVWMQAMDVVVHASDHEPFGIVILEAMALEKPVVAGDAGGPTEILTEGETGLLTPYGDAEALASAILRYLDDPAFARRVGRAARPCALTFSTGCYARSFLAAAREFMEKPCPLGREVM
jgi:glycosyltransferase involved in cell wall biosynthesis